MFKEIEALNNGLLILVALVAAIVCSTILIVINPKISKLWWFIRWGIISLLYPNKYINERYIDLPFVLLNDSSIIALTGIIVFLLYDLMNGTKRGRSVRKHFRALPKLIPFDNQIEEIVTEKIDGSNRQLTTEIIENEREVLNELLSEDSPSTLSELDETDSNIISDEEEFMPLANQSFIGFEGINESAAPNQEYCASCSKPVEKKWNACPFCGEFLDIYEEN